MTRNAAADERAENESEHDVERAEAAGGAAFSDADDRQDDEIDQNAAGHGLMKQERIIGKIAAEDVMQAAADLVEVDHGGVSRFRSSRSRLRNKQTRGQDARGGAEESERNHERHETHERIKAPRNATSRGNSAFPGCRQDIHESRAACRPMSRL